MTRTFFDLRRLTSRALGITWPQVARRLAVALFVVFAIGVLPSCTTTTAPDASDPPPDDPGSNVPAVGTVRGTVRDQFNAPISGVVVHLVQGSLSYGSSAPSSSTGAYEILDAPTGAYLLSASKGGFALSQTPVTVTKGVTTTMSVTLSALSAPAAATVAVRIVSFSPSSMTFELDVAAVNANGTLVNPATASYSLSSFTTNGLTVTFNQVSNTPAVSPAAGPYAAMFMMDQSGSISGTDPNHSRLNAAKAFMAKVGGSDRVRVGAFASGGSLPFDITLYGSWNSVGSSWYSVLDELATKVNGGTPLYKAVAAAINEVATNGGLANRAAIIFTDGDDTDGGWTVDQLVSLATSRGVKLWTVGLQIGSTGHRVLGELAARTGGGFTIASDARQLVSYFGSLGAMLNGGASVARTRWTATVTGGFGSGWLTSSVRVTTSEGTVSAPFYLKYP